MSENNNKPRKRGRRKGKTRKVQPMTTKLQDLLPKSMVGRLRRIAKERTD